MTDVPPVAEGDVQIVLLLGATTFVAWAPAIDAPALMDAFERRAGLPPAARTDRIAQAALRVRIARDLDGPDAERLFTETHAAACLWLALRHWSDGETMRRGLAEQMASRDRAVITASVAVPAPDGIATFTAWAFMVGDRIHDGRDDLAATAPETVRVIDNTGRGSTND